MQGGLLLGVGLVFNGRVRVRHGQNRTHQEQESGPDEPSGTTGHSRLYHRVRHVEGVHSNLVCVCRL